MSLFPLARKGHGFSRATAADFDVLGVKIMRGQRRSQT